MGNMKVKDIKGFQIWLEALCLMDSRIGVKDFNKLWNVYKRSK